MKEIVYWLSNNLTVGRTNIKWTINEEEVYAIPMPDEVDDKTELMTHFLMYEHIMNTPIKKDHNTSRTKSLMLNKLGAKTWTICALISRW